MQLSSELFAKIQKSVVFFESFTSGELLSLLQVAQSHEFAEGDVVFKEGSESDQMFIIQEGTVRIAHVDSDGKKEVLDTLTEGACFGEMGAIDESPRSATAIVVNGPATVLSISAGVLTEKNKQVALKLYRNFSRMLAARLRESNAKLRAATEK